MERRTRRSVTRSSRCGVRSSPVRNTTSSGKSCESRILVPDYVLALLSGNERVEVSVNIDVDGSDVVVGLFLRDDVCLELAFAVALEPGGNLAAISAGCGVDVSVVVHVDVLQTVRKFEVWIDVVDGPGFTVVGWVFEPDDSMTVAVPRNVLYVADVSEEVIRRPGRNLPNRNREIRGLPGTRKPCTAES